MTSIIKDARKDGWFFQTKTNNAGSEYSDDRPSGGLKQQSYRSFMPLHHSCDDDGVVETMLAFKVVLAGCVLC